MMRYIAIRTHEKNRNMLLQRKQRSVKQKYEFKNDDKVRIVHRKRNVENDYQEKQTTEYFTIARRYMRDGKHIHKLTDLLG